MPRFNRKDATDLKIARSVLKSLTASDQEKSAAEKLIERLQTERRQRVAAKKSAGKKPQPKDFASDDDYKAALLTWWSQLTKLAVEREANKVLSDPNSSVYLRRKAYEKLGIKEEIYDSNLEQSAKAKTTNDAPRREDFGFRSGEDWDDFVASGKEAEYQRAEEEYRRSAPPLPAELAALFK